MAEPMNPADVPDELMAAALAARWDLAYPEATARSILAAVLPLHTEQLGAKLGRLTMACPHHPAPRLFNPECIPCHRYSALVGARRLIEGRDRSAEAVRQVCTDTKPAFLMTTEDILSEAGAEQLPAAAAEARAFLAAWDAQAAAGQRMEFLALSAGAKLTREHLRELLDAVEQLAARVAELEDELNELLIADGSVDLVDGSGV